MVTPRASSTPLSPVPFTAVSLHTGRACGRPWRKPAMLSILGVSKIRADRRRHGDHRHQAQEPHHPRRPQPRARPLPPERHGLYQGGPQPPPPPGGHPPAPARSGVKGRGCREADLRRASVGVAHSWIETMPCNFNHRHLAEKVKEGIREAGGTPMELNTISISDGITMGTQGMKTSLVSREVIADSIELVGRGHMFDAIVTIVGCDKTIPAAAMAHVRLGLPRAILYSGSPQHGPRQHSAAA